MTLSQRDLDKAASNLKLKEVAELGQTLGYWTIEKQTVCDDGDRWRFVNIKTPDGLHFAFSGGGWNTENKIHASIDGVKIDDNVKVYEKDVKSYSAPSAPDAYISKDKTAAQIVKDIKRRVIDNPTCIETAQKINARIAQLQASQSGLKQHVGTMLAMGFTKGYRFDESATYSADLYLNGQRFTVYESGRVNFDASCNVAVLPAVLAALKGGEV